MVDQTTGTVITCQPACTYGTGATTVEGPFCVTDGNTIVFTGYDSFGDDWNGGFFNVTITEDGSVNGCRGGENEDVEPDVNVANSCEASKEEFVVSLPVFGCDATPFMGCTAVGDPNFEPCATMDDGSCICNDTQTGLVDGDTFCAMDDVVAVNAIPPPDGGANCRWEF